MTGNKPVARVYIACLLWTAVVGLAVLLRRAPSAPALLFTMRWIPSEKTYPAATPPLPPPPPPPLKQEEKEEEQPAWEGLVRKAAGEDRTVILTSVNQGLCGMLELFFRSEAIRTEDVRKRLVVACLDAQALQLCSQVHWACFALLTPGIDFSGEKLYMNQHYVPITWTRKIFVLTLLKRNYTVVSTDPDVMWLRNPLELLEADRDSDIQVSCDNTEVENANTGFMYVRASDRSVAFFERWIWGSRVFPLSNDQDVFNIITRNDIEFKDRVKILDSNSSIQSAKIRYLHTNNFGGFCKRSKNIRDAYTMHATCCRGLSAKTEDLETVLSSWDLYRNYNHTSANSSNSPSPRPLQWPPLVACPKSWYY